MRIDADSVEGRRRWLAAGAARTIPLLLVAVANTVRLGVVDHLWTVAIVLNVIVLGSVPVLVRGLRTHDLKEQAEAASGTIFVGSCSLRAGQLGQPRFSVLGTRRSAGSFGGWIGGQLLLNGDGLTVKPGKHFGGGTPPFTVRWDEVEGIELTKLPAKFDGGGLDLRMTDGSTLAIEVRGYERLSVALSHLPLP